MRDFNDPNNSFKKFKTLLKSNILEVKENTVNRLNASNLLYEEIVMNNGEIKKQMKAANPRKNCLLNERCVLLRQKIKFRTFYVKQDLFRMNVKKIKDPFCE